MKLRTIVFATVALFAIPAVVTRADDGLRIFPTALLQLANTWTASQKFSNNISLGVALGAPGTSSGEKIQVFGNFNSYTVNDYAVGANNSELWLNAGGTNGGVNFYSNGTKIGGVGVGGFIFPKLSAAPTSAPGAGLATVFAVAGTNSGTCKLQAMAGTSTTPVTILDNIGSGC